MQLQPSLSGAAEAAGRAQVRCAVKHQALATPTVRCLCGRMKLVLIRQQAFHKKPLRQIDCWWTALSGRDHGLRCSRAR